MLEHEPRESKLVAEAVKTTVTCAGAILSWIVVTSGVAFMPFTAGASVVITFIGQAALAASITQCVAGLGRTGAEAFAPQYLDQLDNDAWYQAVEAALDTIALLGVATSVLTTIRTVTTATKATGKPLSKVLKGLNRQERAKLNDELLRLQDPRLTPKILKVKQANRALPKRISATEMQLATAHHIREALAAAVGFASSSMPGNIKALAIGIYEEASQ
jgi:hypothetical protein